MNLKKEGRASYELLNQEIKLHINERLYQTGIIPRSVYEKAKIKIVTKVPR